MSNIPFPLIVPVDDEKRIYEGFIPLLNAEYQIQIRLGPSGYLRGEPTLLKLLETHEQEKDQIQSKLCNAQDIMTFLGELKEIMERTKASTEKPTIAYYETHPRYSAIFSELSKIGFQHVYHISEGMEQITFQTIDARDRTHLVEVKLPLKYPFSLPQIDWDLPVASSSISSSLPAGSLSHIVQQHQALVEQYQPFFDCMDDLDSTMRIVEPDRPQRRHTYRRIALGHHCSLEIEINPSAPMEVKPKVRFFGSAHRVKDLQAKWKTSAWDKTLPIHRNLLDIFQVVSSHKDSVKEDYTAIGDIECGICYSYKLNDTDTPDVICQCSRGFHYQCLYEWLRGNPSTVQSFNVLFGQCPYCNEKINIKVKPSSS